MDRRDIRKVRAPALFLMEISVGETGTILTSSDGSTWVSRTSGTTIFYMELAMETTHLWQSVRRTLFSHLLTTVQPGLPGLLLQMKKSGQPTMETVFLWQ